MRKIDLFLVALIAPMKAVSRAYERVNFVNIIKQTLIIVAVLITAVALNGNWVIISVHVMKQFGISRVELDRDQLDDAFSSVSLQNLRHFWVSAMLMGYGMYFCAGIFLHWFYYVRQKDNPESWKCQPNRWLPRQMEIQEIKEGCLGLFVTNTWSAVVACYAYNEGKYSTLYYNWDEYGMIWFLLQFPLVFLFQDYGTYWLHRILHWPFFYSRFHYVHHRYKQPTPFSVTAIHPIEISGIQFAMIIPLFTVPLHWLPFYVSSVYSYFYQIVTHSGITFKAQWWQPWQMDTVFHDNHHQYHHVNFGINSHWWDIIHDTHRKPDRIYNEHTYYAKGTPVTDISPEQLKNELIERENESVNAYENHINPFSLDDLKSKRK